MIDLRTLLAVLLVADLLLAGMLWIGIGRRLREDYALWAFGLVAQALACGLFCVRGAPQQSAIVLGATLLALSFTLQIAALLAADRRHLPSWVHTGVIAAVAAPFALVVGDPAMATLFGGVVFGTLLLVMAGVAAQLHQPRIAAARALMVTSFALAAAAFFVRGAGAMVSAEPLRAFQAPSLFESGLYLAVYAAVLVGSFGFVLLHRRVAMPPRRIRPSTRSPAPTPAPRSGRSPSASCPARAATPSRSRSSCSTSTTCARKRTSTARAWPSRSCAASWRSRAGRCARKTWWCGSRPRNSSCSFPKCRDRAPWSSPGASAGKSRRSSSISRAGACRSP
jgi:hypothetical protein